MDNTTTGIHLPEINLGEDQVRMLLAIKIFEARLIPLGKAAELAGYSEKLFVDILMCKGISPIDRTELNLREDLENAWEIILSMLAQGKTIDELLEEYA